MHRQQLENSHNLLKMSAPSNIRHSKKGNKEGQFLVHS
jgi:hypothetical protein